MRSMERSGDGPGSWATLLSRLRIPAFLVRLAVSLAVSVLSLWLTNGNVPQPNTIWSLSVSAFLGVAVFILSFLITLNGRLGKVIKAQEDSAQNTRTLLIEQFGRIDRATPLFSIVEATALKGEAITRTIRAAAFIRLDAPPLIVDFAQAQLERTMKLLEELSNGTRADYEGEDRDWILDLTRQARAGICALNVTTVRSDGQLLLDGGPWLSDLGQRYLDAQRAAVRRGVGIRRICVVERLDDQTAHSFESVWKVQKADGIDIRVLDRSRQTGVILTEALPDFVVFDGTISYVTTPAVRGGLLANTAVELQEDRVQDRLNRFEQLWTLSEEPS